MQLKTSRSEGRVILGLNMYHGDVSAALMRGNDLVAAVEEERFRRVKHWAGIPSEAARCCLEMGGLRPSDVDVFAISRNPRKHIGRKLLHVITNRPSASALKDRISNSRRIGNVSAELSAVFGLPADTVTARTVLVEHHPAHLASAFFASGFDTAAVCAIDGFGDFVSTSWGMGTGTTLSVQQRVFFPHSLGMLYLAITQYLGFKKYGDEYKVMGLAPYGETAFVPEIRQLLRLGSQGTFELNLSYFRHAAEGVEMSWDSGEPTIGDVFTPRLEALLGPARKQGQPLDARHEALAASLQAVYEEACFHVLNHVAKASGSNRLCLAGGCAMNSVANGKIRERTPFRDVYIQPAAGDNGTSLGAALHVNHCLDRQPRSFVMNHGYWGPEFGDEEIAAVLDSRSSDLRQCRSTVFANDAEVYELTAERIAAGLVVGWFQGRMEWGARALGNRSILADPRRADMREIINTKIKFRERFRPFAPAILEDAVDRYFVGATRDPFMVQVYPVREDKRGVIPAVTHVDGSGRLQTVHESGNRPFAQLIRAFERRTGVPVLLNTSFNENEPIVLTPSQALDCFLRTDMDVLVLGRTVVVKQPVAE